MKKAYTPDGTVVAIKILKNTTAEDRRRAERILNAEVPAYHACKHPNIGRLLEHKATAHEVNHQGLQTICAFLVLEFYEHLFFDFVVLRPFNEKICRFYCAQLMRALHSMHSNGYAHCDLKPENLMLKNKKNICDLYIVDFGLACFVDQKNPLFRKCGTPGFVAPEVINVKGNQTYNEKCDIFSA